MPPQAPSPGDVYLSHLPAGLLSEDVPYFAPRQDLEQRELDGMRIHIYLLFYEEHALLWSSLEQHFFQFSEKRLNSALAFLEEEDAITIEPAPPPTPWSPEDALVSVIPSSRLASARDPLPWPGTHVESPIIPSTPAPLPFGFPVLLSDQEYAEEVSNEEWGTSRTPFEKMAGVNADGLVMAFLKTGSGKGSSGRSGARTGGGVSARGSIPATPMQLEPGEYFPAVRTPSGPASMTSSLTLPPMGLGSTTPRARQRPLSQNMAIGIPTPLPSTNPLIHTPSFSSMSIPRTRSLYSFDSVHRSGGSNFSRGFIPATSTPPSSDWPSLMPTPTFGPQIVRRVTVDGSMATGESVDEDELDLDGLGQEAELNGEANRTNGASNGVEGLGHAAEKQLAREREERKEMEGNGEWAGRPATAQQQARAMQNHRRLGSHSRSNSIDASRTSTPTRKRGIRFELPDGDDLSTSGSETDEKAVSPPLLAQGNGDAKGGKAVVSVQVQREEEGDEEEEGYMDERMDYGAMKSARDRMDGAGPKMGLTFLPLL